MGNEALPPGPISRKEMKSIVFWYALLAGTITTLVLTPIVWIGFAMLGIFLEGVIAK